MKMITFILVIDFKMTTGLHWLNIRTSSRNTDFRIISMNQVTGISDITQRVYINKLKRE